MKRSVILLLGCLLAVMVNNAFAKKPNECIQIYYDNTTNLDQPYHYGRFNAIMLQNLLGHFPRVQQYIIPISQYKKGQINRCAASIYLGTYYDHKLPKSFIEDFVNTKKNVAWVNYNVWQLSPNQLSQLWNVNYKGITKKSVKERDYRQQPGFYRYIKYKGQVFTKFGRLDPKDKSKFYAEDEMVMLKPLSSDANRYVVAWAYHSTNTTKIPYILRNKNHWYIADNPLSYIDENDRYLVFADILFDLLNKKPLHHGKHYALVRLEDISPNVSPKRIREITDFFYKNKVPFAISLIPIFYDPLQSYTEDPKLKRQLVTQRKQFLEAIRYAKAHGASIIMHGVTHQYKNIKNPYTGTSGDDYEFWDMNKNRPLKEDSVKYVLNRLAKGVALLDKAGLKPAAWLTPHYLASPLDYTVFGQVFLWNVGRVGYMIANTCHLKQLPNTLTFNEAPIGGKYNKERLAYLKPLKVSPAPGESPTGQFFPYEIYGDYYDQRIIPEDLDYIRPTVSEHNANRRTVDDLIRALQRNRVLRDSWASFFVHKEMFGLIKNHGLARFKGDTKALQRLISAVKAAGYQFIDLKKWQKQNLRPKRPEPIEVSGSHRC